MISIEQCRKKLEKYGKKYSDEQIFKIRNTLYQIAKHQLKDFKEGRYDEPSKASLKHLTIDNIEGSQT